MIRARIAPGLDASDAVRLFYTRITPSDGVAVRCPHLARRKREPEGVAADKPSSGGL
jgi:hypothetical protein